MIISKISHYVIISRGISHYGDTNLPVTGRKIYVIISNIAHLGDYIESDYIESRLYVTSAVVNQYIRCCVLGYMVLSDVITIHR